VPLTEDGLKACRDLRAEGFLTNVTLCFSVSQALLAAKAGATYVSPFVGRIDDIFTLSDAILSTEGGQSVEETYWYRSQAYSALGDDTAAAAALAFAFELNPNLETAVNQK